MKLITLCLFLSLPQLAGAQNFEPFQNILNRHLQVSELPGGGLQTAFDYDAAKTTPDTLKDLQKQTEILAKFDTQSLTSKNSATAFWINSYNFFMIKIILEQGFDGKSLKINSVKDLGSFFSPYKIFKEEINNVGGKKMSLDQIEKGTLLGNEYKKKGWKDARIHFAVNCASVGCPPLLKTTYEAKSLDQTLDSNIQKAFNTNRHLHLKGKDLYLTHLFKWYKDDFIEAAGSVKAFIKKYLENDSLEARVDGAEDIEYIEYDWNLNRPQNFKQ